MGALHDAFTQSLRFPKAALWLLWLFFPLYGLIVTAFFLPAEDGYSKQAILAAVTGNFAGVEPTVIMVFNLLGVIPMTYALLVLFDGREQPLPAWPFVLLSFVAGSFGILPYLALRHWGQCAEGPPSRLQRRLDTWVAPAVLLILAVLLVMWGAGGSVHAYVDLWKTKPLVNVMTTDFVILLAVLPALALDDMRRRAVQGRFWRPLVVALPLFGALFYLLARPRLAYRRNG